MLPKLTNNGAKLQLLVIFRSGNFFPFFSGGGGEANPQSYNGYIQGVPKNRRIGRRLGDI